MWNHSQCGIIQERERGRAIYLLDLLLPQTPSLLSHWSKFTLRDINSPYSQIVLQGLPGLSLPHGSASESFVVEGARAFVDPVSSDVGTGTAVTLSWESVIWNARAQPLSWGNPQ